MWTCRNCNAENSDELKVCAACGEKNVTPPKGAEVKRERVTIHPEDSEREAIRLLRRAAMVQSIFSGILAAVALIYGLFSMQLLMGIVVAAVIAAGAVPLHAILKGMAVIIQKL